MRKVVLYELLSIDGVGEEPGNWMFDVDDAFMDRLGRVIGNQDDVLLGRNTYDYWVGYWPTSDHQPFADFINGSRKHVFTSRALADEWSGSTIVEAPAVDYVTELKRQHGKDIGIHGSMSLGQSLLRAGLVDEMHLAIAPTVAGRGRRLFDADGVLQRFDLVEFERTPTGIALLGYAKRGSARQDE